MRLSAIEPAEPIDRKMRWITFAIVLYLILALQGAVAPYLALHTVWPDFLVIVGVYFALTARAPDAMLACWIIGLMTDLASLSYGNRSNIGIHALCFGLLAVGIVRIRDLTFRESIWSQLFYTFTVKLLLASAVGLYMLYSIGALDRFGEVFNRSFYEAVYTAALAPYGHWLLRQFRGPLGITAVERWGVR